MADPQGGAPRPPVKVLVGTSGRHRASLVSRLASGFLGRLSSPATLICVVVAILIAFRWYSNEVENHLDFIDAEQRAFRESGNLARFLEDHAIRMIQLADHDLALAAREMAADCNSERLTALRPGRKTGHALAAYNAQGELCAGSFPPNAAQKDWFAAHRAQKRGDGPHFTLLKYTGPAAGSWVMVSREVVTAQGTFGGIVLLELSVDELLRPAGKLDLGPDGIAMISTLEGAVLARQNGLSVSSGARTATEWRLGASLTGIHRGVDGIDNVPRFISYRRMADFPLIAAVGVSEGEALAGAQARADARRVASGVAILVLVLAAVGATLLLRALAAARVRGESAERLKTEFLMVMSHELRTPLNGVLGFSELLEKHVTTDTARQFLQVIRDSGQQLQGLVDDLLAFADVESGKAVARLRVEPLAPMIERITALHAQRIADKGLAFETIIEPGTPESAYFDAGKTVKILDHLLQNATKFTAKGAIVLHLNATAKSVVVSVTDSGSGIAEAAQAHLAESFRQADGTITREHGGVGLGLALCAGLARLMGLQLEFSSIPGEGSTFSIHIPRAAPGAA